MRSLRTRPSVLVLATVMFMATVVPNARGQCQANEFAKLPPCGQEAGDEFGLCVSASGDWAVVGAWGDDEKGQDAGAAYVFRSDGLNWVFKQKLLADDGEAGDHFAVSVSVRGNVILVGADRDDDNGPDSGAAYVFRYDDDRDTWYQEQKLLAEDGDNFGASVCVDADTAVIGARFTHNQDNVDTGAAYVFRCDDNDTPDDPMDDSWFRGDKLLADDGEAADLFGESVSLDGDVALVGAPRDDDNGEDSGSAYVFRRDDNGTPDDPNDDSWFQEDKLLPADGAAGDYFGESVAISGDRALIGAFFADSAYVFRLDGGDNWLEEQKLTASDSAGGEYFGISVSLDGDIVAIGAQLEDDSDGESGSAYVFWRDDTSWVEAAKLTASDGTDGDYFGRSVSVSAGLALVGAPGDDYSSGSAYVFHGLSDCQPNGTLDICDIENGDSQDDNGNGIPDECECSGDIDGDGATDQRDLGILLALWGCCEGDPCYDRDADLDGDGCIGQGDLGILLADWGCAVE